MRRVFIFMLVLILQAACSVNSPAPARISTAPVQQAAPAQSPTPEDTIYAKAWIIDKEPSLDSRIVVHGSLYKNGVMLGGMMMWASWPDENSQPGVPNCSSLVTYGAGKCIIDVSKYPPGEFVPVTIYFDYQGKRYTDQTGFTPRAP